MNTTDSQPVQASVSDHDRLMAVLARAGSERVDPGILQPASVFVDLAGEDMRRRMLTTSDLNGTEHCLRPDFTLPVALQHLARGGDEPARYAYLGPVFRQRNGTAHEVLQAGVEDFGQADTAQTDADVLVLALRALSALGKRQLTIRIGDKALYSDLVASLPLADWHRRRLMGAFGDRNALAHILTELATGDAAPADGKDGAGKESDDSILGALQGLSDEQARRVAGGLVEASNAGGLAGRSAEEIVDRLMMRRERAKQAWKARTAVDPLRKLLAVGGPANEAEDDLKRLADGPLSALGDATTLFSERLKHLAAAGVPADHMTFEASFGRPLDYYTGFEFEIYDGDSGARLVGGGRYDQLCTRLGAESPVSAIGFAIWLEPGQ